MKSLILPFYGNHIKSPSFTRAVLDQKQLLSKCTLLLQNITNGKARETWERGSSGMAAKAWLLISRTPGVFLSDTISDYPPRSIIFLQIWIFFFFLGGGGQNIGRSVIFNFLKKINEKDSILAEKSRFYVYAAKVTVLWYYAIFHRFVSCPVSSGFFSWSMGWLFTDPERETRLLVV